MPHAIGELFNRMPYYDQIPTETDWADLVGVWQFYEADLDYAHDRFYGKSIDEVMDYFYCNVLEAQEDVFYMPRRPFAYYIQAFVRYLKEAAENPDDHRFSARSDGASSFLNMIMFRLQHSPNVICPVMDELFEIAQFVADNQIIYEAETDIYGWFPELLSQIQVLYRQQCANQA